MAIRIDTLPSGIREIARSVDVGYGNADGFIDSAELDRFEAVHGGNPIYQQHFIKVVRDRLRSAGEGQAEGNAAIPAHSPTLRVSGPPEAESLERRELARQLVCPGGSGTNEDVTAVAERVVKIPVAILRALREAGYSIVACRGSVTDYWTEYRGVTPRGWPPGRTWDDVPGGNDATRREVVVATKAEGTTRTVRSGLTAHNCYDLVLHEVGHAVDSIVGASKTPEFLACWRSDGDLLGPYETMSPPAGPEEAFAETFARCLLNLPVARIKRPNLAGYFERELG